MTKKRGRLWLVLDDRGVFEPDAASVLVTEWRLPDAIAFLVENDLAGCIYLCRWRRLPNGDRRLDELTDDGLVYWRTFDADGQAHEWRRRRGDPVPDRRTRRHRLPSAPGGHA